MLFPSVSLIRGLKLRPSRKLGQNFLIDKNTVLKILAASDLAKGDVVIEIGAGLGSLTLLLAEKVARLTAFEIDQRLVDFLDKTLPRDAPVTLVKQDILSIRFSDFVKDNTRIIVIGNIPYAITTPLFFKLLQELLLIKRAILIVQKEVAARLLAPPATKDYGVLSVYAQTYLKTSRVFDIPAACFYPRPKVDASLITLEPRQDRQWHAEGEAFFRQVVKTALSHRRKTLLNCLKGFPARPQLAEQDLKTLSIREDIDLKRRGETFTIAEFDKLTAMLKELLEKKN